jgi:hypothetical protein
MKTGQVLRALAVCFLAVLCCEFFGKRLGMDSLRPSTSLRKAADFFGASFRWVGYWWARLFDFAYWVEKLGDLAVRVWRWIVEWLQWFLPLEEIVETFVAVACPLIEIILAPFQIFIGWIDALDIAVNPSLTVVMLLAGMIVLVGASFRTSLLSPAETKMVYGDCFGNKCLNVQSQ